MADISIDVNGYRINLRVGAVLTSGTEFLTCHMRDKDWCFLPGGRIKTNESSLEALKRELSEEVGEGFRIVRPLVCAENFFEIDSVPFHEICTFYQAEWTKGSIRKQPETSHEIFKWVPLNKAGKINLKPEFIKKHIINPDLDFELIIHRDDE